MANGKQVKGCLCPSQVTGQQGWSSQWEDYQLTDNPMKQAPGCPFIFIMCEVGGCKVSFLFI
jgi:hypothetical protein